MLFHIRHVATFSSGWVANRYHRPSRQSPGNFSFKTRLNQYLVYFQDTKKHQQLGFWFWLRDIKIISRNGEPVFVINQHWYGSDSAAYRTVYSINRVKDFSPVYHAEFKPGKMFAYNLGCRQNNRC